ncbi:MAG: hypothetical protein KA352_09485 [Flavobacteriales bacterium]|nr:hypothetical protein [Flavobacteriales bacterium]
MSSSPLNWRRVADSESVEELYAHYGLSERALLCCQENGLKNVRAIRQALRAEEEDVIRDNETRKELLALVGTEGRPAHPRKPQRHRKPTREQGIHRVQLDETVWPGMPDDVRAGALVDPKLDVRILYAHLSSRCRNAVDRYLRPEYDVADLDKLIYTNFNFRKMRDIGVVSVGELDNWRRELRQLRAAAAETVQWSEPGVGAQAQS